MIVGEIYHLNTEKKYGFIKSKEYPTGVFFHLKNFNGTFDELQKGDKVSFEAVETPKGMAAEKVQLV